jgi:peptidyl-prolyl cis-trans isomerase C
VVLKVNDQTLRADEFAELLASRLKMFNQLSARDSVVIAHAKSAIVQEFIVQVVTHAWAQKKQLFVLKDQIEKEVTTYRKQYPDDASFRAALAHEGLTLTAWEERLKRSLLEKIVLSELRKSILKPSSDERKAYYQAHKSRFQRPAAIKIRQIVLNTEEDAKRMKKELSQGKNFAAMAKQFSVSPEGQNGGDAGWIEQGMADAFDKAFHLGVGQRSQILKSPFGYHIILVEARRAPKTFKLEDVIEKVDAAILAEKEQVVYSAWLEEQVVKSQIYKDDGFINQIQVNSRSAK